MVDRAYSTLVPRLAPHAPQCPNATLIAYIREAAIQTCERTLIYRYQPPLFNLLPGVHEYAYQCPTNTDVHAVFATLVNNRALDNLNLEDAIRKHPEWANLYSGEDASVLWSETPSDAFDEFVYNEELFNEGSEFVLPDAIIAEAGSPRTITQVSVDRYIVLPLPDDQTYEVRMFLALKPKRDSTGMNDTVFNEIEDLIFHRALQNLLVMPNVPWSDRDAVQYHAKQYSFLVGEKRARANLGNVRGSLTARGYCFA